MSSVERVCAEYVEWLRDFLPADYLERPERYRFDEDLRRRYQREACDEGWLVPQWPHGLGGRGLEPLEAVAVRVQSATLQAPKLLNIQSAGVVAPSLYSFGTDEQRERYLMPTLRGELNWALGMSEPSAGSDLASLRTRATRRDGSFFVGGQKVWTTQAHESDLMLLLCRTDPEADRHRGISCLLVDLDAPGITVRVIDTGWPDTDEFCEVFLDDVEVPEDRLLGDLNGGWRVAMGSLSHERDMIWVENYAAAERALRQAAASIGAGGRPSLEAELGRRLTDVAALRLTGLRALESRLAGGPAPEFDILKLFGSETLQASIQLALDAGGEAALGDPELLLDDYEALGATLYGGTSEIQRNIIAERVLGLPRG
jgi:alkylation response protein AidB-like acyl-CoA dehydrogenase